MAYLGEEPKFGSFASETFSGNGSATSFTLTHGAASPSSLLVTIDGVKQQTTAYTITDTALDFGAGNAPAAGTNNIEVVYLGTKSLVGAVADGAITTSKIANNAVTGAKIAMGSDAAGDILTYTGTDYVRLAKGTASQTLKMNSGASAVEWATAADNTPRFQAFLSVNQSPANSTWTKVQFNGELDDSDGAYDASNHKFTVPVGEGGTYFFYSNVTGGSSTTGNVSYFQIVFYKNGSIFSNGPRALMHFVGASNTQTAKSIQTMMILVPGDYIEIYGQITESGSNCQYRADYCSFGGYKLL